MSLYDDVVTDFSVPSTSETKKDTGNVELHKQIYFKKIKHLTNI